MKWRSGKTGNQEGAARQEKVAVIGAGPAGLSCAYYLGLKGYPVTILKDWVNRAGCRLLGFLTTGCRGTS